MTPAAEYNSLESPTAAWKFKKNLSGGGFPRGKGFIVAGARLELGADHLQAKNHVPIRVCGASFGKYEKGLIYWNF